MSKQQYKYVPSWLARRYPEVAALEENPLALYLSGCAYRRRGWFGGLRRMTPLAKWPFIIPVLIIFGLLPCGLGLLILPAALTAYRYIAFERMWRQFSREGKLQEWWLTGLKPEEFVSGIAGGCLIGALRAHLWAAFIWSALFSMIVFSPRLLNSSYFMEPICMSLGGCFYGVGVIFTIQLTLAIDSIYTTLDSIGVSVQRAGCNQDFGYIALFLKKLLRSLAFAFIRFIMPIHGIIIFSVMFFILSPHFTDFAALIAIDSVFLFFLALMIYGHFVITMSFASTAYPRAVESARAHLLDVIESNPPQYR